MKKLLGGLHDKMLQLEDKVDKCTDYALAASMRVQSSETVDNAAALLQLKWTNVTQSWEAMDTIEGREAIKRVLHSAKLTEKHSKIAGKLLQLFFSKELIGRLYCGPPSG